MSRARPTKTHSKGYVQKPKSNVYTMLLILSFFSICAACVCLYVEMDEYDYDLKAKEATLSLPPKALPKEPAKKKAPAPPAPKPAAKKTSALNQRAIRGGLVHAPSTLWPFDSGLTV